MLNFAKDIGLLAALIAITSLIAALPVGFLGKIHRWPVGRCRNRTVVCLVVVCLFWWCWTHWVHRMTTPVEWLGHDIGAVAQGFGFFAWILLSRQLAIQIATKIAIPTTARPVDRRNGANVERRVFYGKPTSFPIRDCTHRPCPSSGWRARP